jgi:hypothetical protein
MDARRPLSVHFRRPRPTAPPPAPRRAPRAERMCDGQLKQCFALLLLLLSAALPTAAVATTTIRHSRASSAAHRRRVDTLAGPTASFTTTPPAAAVELLGRRWRHPETAVGGSVRVCEVAGADPTGHNCSSAAIERVIAEAWVSAGNRYTLQSNPDLADLGGRAIDFCGGHYLLSQPVRFPAVGGGNVVLTNGALHASSSFPRTGFLLEVDQLTTNATTYRYRYLSFVHMEFDSANASAGGVKLEQAEGTRFLLCRFIGFQQVGLWSTGYRGNELYVDMCWFQELHDISRCHEDGLKTGTAIQLDNPDHSVANSVIMCTRTGIVASGRQSAVLRAGGSASVARNVHIYTIGTTEYPFGCAHLATGTKHFRFLGCYFDGCPVFVDDPDLLTITDSLFLLLEGSGSANLSTIVLTPTQPLQPVQGLEITGNVVSGVPPKYEPLAARPVVLLNETAGSSFDHHHIVRSVVERNRWEDWETSHAGLRGVVTRLTETRSFVGPQSRFEFDLAESMLFREIYHVTYSLRVWDPADPKAGWVQHRLADVRGAQVVVETLTPVKNVTISVVVEQSREGSLYPPSPAQAGSLQAALKTDDDHEQALSAADQDDDAKCGNETADLPCEVFLHGNLCDDKDLIGGVAAGTLSSCFAACQAVTHCEYFGLERTPNPWCIRYRHCVPRSDPAGSSTYTTYAMTTRAGPVPPPEPVPPLIEETFWQITDIHLNPDYPKGCPSPCGTFADHFCGSSPALYTAAVQFMARQNSREQIRPPAFVAHTGDMPDMPGGNVSAIWALAQWQADALYRQFPATPVFFSFGNHDFDPSTPDDCPYLPGCATHYAAVCAAFGRDLDAAARASCAATGYYFVDHKVPGVRIVVLNTEYFGWEQGVDLGNHTHAAAADAHLRWLESVVAGAQGKVMILGHIPPASGELLPFLPPTDYCTSLGR